METCIKACIAKDLGSHRIQVNAGDKIKLYKKYKSSWKIMLFGKGVVTITDHQLNNNFGTPIHFQRVTNVVDESVPIGLVPKYEG